MTVPLDTPAPEHATSAADARRRRGSAVNLTSLILAALLLGASLAFGAWLIASAPEAPRAPYVLDLASLAERSSYGGDAYTGMQNAAADTENSLVAGTNKMIGLASALQENQLEADAAWWGHLSKGLAALVVAIAAGNFITVLQRFGTTRRRPS
jgi:hypothetical protein